MSKISINSILFFALFICTANASVLTERDIIFTAIQNNSDIRIAQLDIRSDSLTLESVNSQRLPSLVTELEQQISPYDSVSSILSAYSTPSVATGLEVNAIQQVPGGGTVTGTLLGERWSHLDTDSSNYSTSVSIKYTQPLLNGAWKNDVVGYTIALQRLDNKTFTLQQKKAMLATLSSVRNLYWSLYEKQSLCAIFSDRKQYAEKHLSTQRTRFNIGNATKLDTLSAHLDYLEAMRLFLGAKTDAALAQRELATALTLPLDSTRVDTVPDIHLSDLPGTDDFIAQVEAFDPQVKIFEILDTRLQQQMLYNKNQLLPDITLEAGYTRSLTGDAFFDDTRAFSGNAVIALILRYSLPVKSRRIEKEQTGIALQKNALAQQHYSREISRQVEMLVMTWQQELQTLDIAKASRYIAQQQFDAAKAGYDIGTVDQLTLDKAENDYLEMAIRLLQKQVVMKKLEIIFDEITGTVLSRFGVTLQ